MTGKSLFLLSSLLILFLIQLQSPDQSIPGDRSSTAVSAGKTLPDHPSEKAAICQIRTRDKVIIIHSGDQGQLYTVKTREGNVLAADLNAGELNARFPELRELVKNGLAGDASLRVNHVPDDKNPAIIKDINK